MAPNFPLLTSSCSLVSRSLSFPHVCCALLANPGFSPPNAVSFLGRDYRPVFEQLYKSSFALIWWPCRCYSSRQSPLTTHPRPFVNESNNTTCPHPSSDDHTHPTYHPSLHPPAPSIPSPNYRQAAFPRRPTDLFFSSLFFPYPRPVDLRRRM